MYTTYDIFDDLLGMRNWVDRYFNETPSFKRGIEYPYVNLYEADDTIEITVVAPGLNDENLHLELVDNNLLIKGDKNADYEDTKYIRKERKFGKFHKTVRLPYKVDANNIKASMKNGILTIHLTKSEDAKPKKIEIH